MPAPQKSQLAQLAKNFFIAKMIFLPINWASTGPQFPDAFDPSELVVAPNSPTNLFREPTLNKYHVDTAKDIGKGFADYIDGICEGICDGIDKWMKGASVAGVIINGPVGVVRPGCVLGPPLAPAGYGQGANGHAAGDQVLQRHRHGAEQRLASLAHGAFGDHHVPGVRGVSGACGRSYAQRADALDRFWLAGGGHAFPRDFERSN